MEPDTFRKIFKKSKKERKVNANLYFSDRYNREISIEKIDNNNSIFEGKSIKIKA